jgi:hypothetical protein
MKKMPPRALTGIIEEQDQSEVMSPDASVCLSSSQLENKPTKPAHRTTIQIEIDKPRKSPPTKQDVNYNLLQPPLPNRSSVQL